MQESVHAYVCVHVGVGVGVGGGALLVQERKS